MTKLNNLPLTRAIFIAITPRLPEFYFEQRIRGVEEELQMIEDYCAEKGITMPGVALMIDPLNQDIALEYEDERGQFRFNQIMFRMKNEFDQLVADGLLDD